MEEPVIQIDVNENMPQLTATYIAEIKNILKKYPEVNASVVWQKCLTEHYKNFLEAIIFLDSKHTVINKFVTNEYLKLILSYKHSQSQALALAQAIALFPHLYKEKSNRAILLNQCFFDMAEKPVEIARCMDILTSTSLLAQKGIKKRLFNSSENIADLANILSILQQAKILNWYKFEWLTNLQPRISFMHFYLKELFRTYQQPQPHINERVFYELCHYYPILKNNKLQSLLLAFLSKEELTQEIYPLIIRICQNHPKTAVNKIEEYLLKRKQLFFMSAQLFKTQQFIPLHDAYDLTSAKFNVSIWMALFCCRIFEHDLLTYMTEELKFFESKTVLLKTSQEPQKAFIAMLKWKTIHSFLAYFNLETEESLNLFLVALDNLCRYGISDELFSLIAPMLEESMLLIHGDMERVTFDNIFSMVKFVKFTKSDMRVQMQIETSTGYRQFCSRQAKDLFKCQQSFFAKKAFQFLAPPQFHNKDSNLEETSYPALTWGKQ